MTRGVRAVLAVALAAACGDDDGGGTPADAMGDGGAGVDAMVGQGELSVVPESYDFGSVLVGGTAFYAVNVSNVGNGSIGPLASTVGGSEDFAIVNDGCAGATLLPGSDPCGIELEFTPSTVAGSSGTLTVSGPGSSTEASLSGTGRDPLPAQLVTSPPSVNWGSSCGGFLVDVTLTNMGDLASGIPAAVLAGADAANFMIATDGCTEALGGGASCTISLEDVYTGPGTRTAELQVTATPGGTAITSLTVPAPSCDFGPTISPSPFDFGSVMVGSSSANQVFTVTNIGGTPSGPMTTSLSGADLADFVVVEDLCDGMTLAGGTTCTITIQFSPGSTGAKSATLTVTATGGGSAAAALAGTGT